MPNGCVPGKKKKNSADYKAEEEQEWCSRKSSRKGGGGCLSRGHGGPGTRAETEREGQERDKMAAYEHSLERAFLQVL